MRPPYVFPKQGVGLRPALLVSYKSLQAVHEVVNDGLIRRAASRALKKSLFLFIDKHIQPKYDFFKAPVESIRSRFACSAAY